MIGTSYEMLLFFAYQRRSMEVLGMTKHRLQVLRNRVQRRVIAESDACKMLTRFECKCIRPQLLIPAIIKDKNGRLYDEFTFIKYHFSHDIAKRYGVDYDTIMKNLDNHKPIQKNIFGHIMRKRRASIIIERSYIDSIWSYEPIDVEITDERLVDIRRILGYREWENGE